MPDAGGQSASLESTVRRQPAAAMKPEIERWTSLDVLVWKAASPSKQVPPAGERTGVFEFTERARRVVGQAYEEAYAHCNDYVGTEHLLLGLIHDRHDAVVEMLQVLGLGAEAIRRQVEETIGPPAQRPPPAHLPFSPQVKNAVKQSWHEAQLRGHDLVDAEDILCGLTRQTDCAAAQALADLGIEPARIANRCRCYPQAGLA